MTEFEARGHKADSPLSVSQLNWYLKQVVEEAAPRVWLEGEVGDLSRPSSGHIYFSLKDDRSQIRAVIWRSAAQLMKLPLKDGMSIICRGAVEVYPPRGTYQIVVDKVEAQLASERDLIGAVEDRRLERLGGAGGHAHLAPDAVDGKGAEASGGNLRWR